MIKSLRQIADSDDATMLFFRAHYARMEEIEKQNELDISAARALDNRGESGRPESSPIERLGPL